MKISNVRRESDERSSRLVSRVEWEDCDRAPLDVFFRVEKQFCSMLSEDSHALLAGALIPAMKHRERRIQVEQPVCPEMLQRLETVGGMLSTWYDDLRPLTIEAKVDGCKQRKGPDKRLAAGYLSGGVDSLALFKMNRQRYPECHPRWMSVGMMIYGLDLGLFPDLPQEGIFDSALETMRELAPSIDMTVVPVYTNVRHIDNSFGNYERQYVAGYLTSVAHALGGGVRHASIASGDNDGHMHPWGTHPAIDPNYSSGSVEIYYDCPHLLRYHKIESLLDWPEALDRIRVCTERPEDRLNCGKCEKCIRTEFALLAHGKLAQSKAFEYDDLTREFILQANPYISAMSVPAFEHYFPRMQEMGRGDLVHAIQKCFMRSYWHRTARKVAKQVDKKLTGGRVTTSYRRMQGRA
jgi:hypothetical protein